MREKLLNLLRSKHEVIGVCCLVCVACALRVYRLTGYDVWFDEAYAILSSINIQEYLVKGIFLDTSPPLYQLVLHGWIALFGSGITSVRLVSVLCGAGAIPLIYCIARYCYDKKTAVVSALLLTFSPLHVWYSQEARSYSLNVFLTMACVWCALRVCHEYKRKWMILFCGLFFGAIYVHYYNAFIVLPAAMIVFFRNPMKRWKLLCVMFFASIPVLYLLFYHSVRVKDMFWFQGERLRAFLVILQNYALGFNALTIFYWMALGIMLFLLVLWFAHKNKSPLLVVYIVLVPFITYVVSWVVPVFVVRLYLVFLPYYYIAISWALISMRTRLGKVALGACLGSMMMISLISYYTHAYFSPLEYHYGVTEKRSFAPLVEFIRKDVRPNDLIAHASQSTLQPLLYYFREIPVDQAYLIIPENQDDYWKKSVELWDTFSKERSRTDIFRERTVNQHKTVKRFADKKIYYPGKRLWLVLADWQRKGVLEEHEQRVRARARERFTFLRQFEYDGVFVELYDMGDPNAV